MDYEIDCDSKYVNGLSSMLYSLSKVSSKNNPNNFYFMYWNDTPLKEKEIMKIKKALRKNDNLYLIEIEKPDFIFKINSLNFGPQIFIRLLAPFYCENIESIIHLDADIIFLKDPTNYLNQKIKENCVVCGVRDRQEGFDYFKSKFKTSKDFYINTGLLKIDIQKYRERFKNIVNLGNELMEVLKNNWIYPDQDFINLIFDESKDEIKNQNFMFFPFYTLNKSQNPYMIHYIGRKPWDFYYDTNLKFSLIFWKYGIRFFGFKHFFKCFVYIVKQVLKRKLKFIFHKR